MNHNKCLITLHCIWNWTKAAGAPWPADEEGPSARHGIRWVRWSLFDFRGRIMAALGSVLVGVGALPMWALCPLLTHSEGIHSDQRYGYSARWYTVRHSWVSGDVHMLRQACLSRGPFWLKIWRFAPIDGDTLAREEQTAFSAVKTSKGHRVLSWTLVSRAPSLKFRPESSSRHLSYSQGVSHHDILHHSALLRRNDASENDITAIYDEEADASTCALAWF